MKLKILSLIVLSLAVSACEKIITQKDMQLAVTYCSERGGVFSIGFEDSRLVKYITCKNGDTTNSSKARKHD